MDVQPYIYFEGRAEEAAAFYGKTLGAKINVLMRYSESPHPMPPEMVPPGSESKVMHMEMQVGNSKVLASDGLCSGKPVFQGISLTVRVEQVDEATRIFTALADGGKVQMPLSATFFAKSFGMVADMFGVSWMVIAPLENPGA